MLRRLTEAGPRLVNSLPEVLRAALWLSSPWVQRWCKMERTLKGAAKWYARQSSFEEMPFNALRPMGAEAISKATRLVSSGRTFPMVTVALQRFKNFPISRDVARDLGKYFGLYDQVERTRSYVFIGATSGAFHTDMQDNVIVQLAGKADIFVFPSFVLPDRARAGHGLPVGPLLNWLEDRRFPGRRQLPFFHVTLKAGEGITIPSMSPHRVVTGDSTAIRMNSFFEPRLGQMQWSQTPRNAFGHFSKAYLAMRILWLRSLTYLWETKGVCVFMQGNSAEFL